MDLKSIHSVFTNRILRIPSYQRGYSWTNNKPVNLAKPEDFKSVKGQLMDLWSDIVNIPEGKWHYTGLLTLVEIESCSYSWLPNYKQYAIVDGQQRITTILILIAVLVESASQLGFEFGVREGDTTFQYLYIKKSGLKAYIFGYDEDNPSDKYFRKHILNLDEIEDDSQESVYTENLRNAKIFFQSMLEQYLSSEKDQQQRLQALFDRVTGDLRVNEYVLPKDLDEYVVFETMNNRGKPLSELEKLKNRLMYLSDKFDCEKTDAGEMVAFSIAQKEELEKSINKGWITIYQSLGANKSRPLDDDDFIKNHWIAYFDRYDRSKSNAHVIHLFNEYFTLGQVYDKKINPDHIRAYVKSMQKCAVIWSKMHHPSFFDSTAESTQKQAVLALHRVGFRVSFQPLVLACLQQDKKDEFLEVIGLLESYAFKIFHISDRQSNAGDSKLYRMASRIYHSKLSVQDAVKEIQGHINYYYSFSLFESQLKELFETGERKGFYDWSGLRYFLFEYDKSLRRINRVTTEATELRWKDFNTKNTIEHIYPQSAARDYQQFCAGNDSPDRKDAYAVLQGNWSEFAEYSSAQRNRLCNSLGNLLAISHSDNASLSNDPFLHKVDQSIKGESYKNRGYRFDSMSAQIVAKNTEWTPESIKNRGILMLDSILEMLNESSDRISVNEKLRILGLEFMIEADKQQELTSD